MQQHSLNKSIAQIKPPHMGPGSPFHQKANEPASCHDNLQGAAMDSPLQQTLREQAELFRQLTENIQEVFWLASADECQVFYVSRSYEDIWGRSCESLLRDPMSWLEAVHPEDRPRVEAELALDRGHRFTREYRIVRPGGTIRWILARGFSVPDEKGSPYRIAGLAEDITERKQAAQAARKSASDLAEAQRLARMGSWSFDLRTKEVVWSDELCRIFGLEKSEFNGTYEAFVSCVHPDDRPRVLRIGTKARADGHPFEMEYRIVTPRGEEKVIREIGGPMKDDEGQFVGLIGSAQDITGRKQAGENLQRLAAIVESSDDAIISNDLEGGILTWNPAAGRMMGYEAKEIIGQNVALLIPENLRAMKVAHLEKLRKGRRIQHCETIRLKKDGTPVAVSLTISPVRDASGQITGASTVMRDLSEREQAEKKLMESEMRYRLLFENMVEGFALCRMLVEEGRPQDFVYLEVNQVFEKMTGLRNIAGRKASEVLPGRHESDPEFLERYARVARTGQPEQFEIYFVALKDWYSISVYCPAKGYFVAVFAVITGRKQAEQRMQMFSQEIVAAREEERKLVSSVLHHDVGSLAVGISAYLDAIEKDLRSEKLGKALQWMKRTRELFDQSVAQLKRLAVELRPPDLDVLGLRAVLKQQFSQITKQKETRIRFSGTLWRRRLSANATTVLFRVAQEALNNAINHGHATQVDFRLGASKGKVSLTVRDNGTGFDASEQRARVSSSLGLRVMQEMAASAGGDFTVDSGRGQGTTVRVSLPIGAADLGPADAAPREETAEPGEKNRSVRRRSRSRRRSRA
jgi:PAS domain S-box-containing protein